MSFELEHLELLAEFDTMLAEVQRWAEGAPDWPAAREVQALVRRLTARSDRLRSRLDAPLVVATLGGTGTGKSALVNALVGEDVTSSGRQRPTTLRPVLVCRPGLTARDFGIDPDSVTAIERDLPGLRDLAIVDCPDPDTTETESVQETNLDRLRKILPHCDVLLVTTTQQKYRSARVSAELAAAAPGAKLVFVQTHADIDTDIRDDWRRQLAAEYSAGELFFVDSLAALSDRQAGSSPRGEFSRLWDFLVRELTGAAAKRIRRANFLDLVAATLAACRTRIDAVMPTIERLEKALAEERAKLAGQLATRMRDELLANRRAWEQRLLGEIASRWGFSPFSALLRVYQGIGGLLASATLWRARSPAQLALWGAMESGRRLRNRRARRRAESATRRAASAWEEDQLRTAALVMAGYAGEAGLPRNGAEWSVVRREADQSGERFVETAEGELQKIVARLAARHARPLARWPYEIALLAMLGMLLYRFGRNFFFDSWLAYDLGLSDQPRETVLGVDFFVSAGFLLFVWCWTLLWWFTSRLRRGVQQGIQEAAEHWSHPKLADGILAGLERQAKAAREFRDGLPRLEANVARLQESVARQESKLGRKTP